MSEQFCYSDPIFVLSDQTEMWLGINIIMSYQETKTVESNFIPTSTLLFIFWAQWLIANLNQVCGSHFGNNLESVL